MKTAILAGMGFLAALGTGAAHAQQNYNGVRVMVAADDGDNRSVVRSSDMYHRGQIPMNEELKRYGYWAIFPEAVEAELGWNLGDRSPKARTLQMAKKACDDGKTSVCTQVVALVRTMASAEDLGFGAQAKVRMTGELINTSTNAYLGGYEVPEVKFSIPKGCNEVCLQDAVGSHAREISLALADTLRKMLDQQALKPGNAGGGAVTGGSKVGGGLISSLAISFEHFALEEITPLLRVMREEFPDTVEVGDPTGGSGFFKINMQTRAKKEKILEWISLMMDDRGYKAQNLRITSQPNGFVIDRIVDDGYRPTRPARVYQ